VGVRSSPIFVNVGPGVRPQSQKVKMLVMHRTVASHVTNWSTTAIGIAGIYASLDNWRTSQDLFRSDSVRNIGDRYIDAIYTSFRNFYRPSNSYACAVLAVVILSVRLSVCHTRAL